MFETKNVWQRINVILAFTTIFQFNLLSQKGIMISVPENDTLILKGNVNVLHCPNHYYEDTTLVDYLHYIVIFKHENLVKYNEIWDSTMRDTVMIESCSFSIENDTMYFYSETEFLNFSGLGKTLFLSYPIKNNSMNITPRLLKSDTLQKWGIDTSYFYFIEFDENIIEKTREFSLVKNKDIQNIKINLFESSKLKGTSYRYHGFHRYNSINQKSISGKIDSTRFYSTLVVDEIRELTKKDSQCTNTNSTYKRLEKLPSRYLQLLN